MTTGQDVDEGRDIMSKAGAIVSALEREGELTAARLAVHVDEPVSSTYRLLQNLSTIGWVEPGSGRGLFRLGVFFIRIGAHLEDRLDVRRAALPELERLRALTGWTSFLCYRRGDRGVCVERVEGARVRLLAMEIGDSLPLFAGAASLALFAHLPAAERSTLLDAFTPDRTLAMPTVPERGRLEAILEQSRSAGYTRSVDDVTLGVAAFGTPVFNHRGELAAAISVSGLKDQLLADEERIAALLQEASAATSARLGYEPRGDRDHA